MATLLYAGVGAGQVAPGAPVAITRMSLGAAALYPGGSAGGYTVTFALPAGKRVTYVRTLHPVVVVAEGIESWETVHRDRYSTAGEAVENSVERGATNAVESVMVAAVRLAPSSTRPWPPSFRPCRPHPRFRSSSGCV
jgi:L-fucose isomerase-like protein